MKRYRVYDIVGSYIGRLALEAETINKASVTRKGDVIRFVETNKPHMTARVARKGDVWGVTLYVNGQPENSIELDTLAEATLHHSDLLRAIHNLY